MILAGLTRKCRKHVFADLRPYTCPYPACPKAEEEFARRHEWMQHVLEQHWVTWKCPFACQEVFVSSKELKEHILQHHTVEVTGELDTIVIGTKKTKSLQQAIQCPLCLETLASMNQFQRHVGRHQTDLALFSLPRNQGESEDKQDGSDDESISASESEDNIQVRRTIFNMLSTLFILRD